jgi:hypothetical protein
MSQEYKFDKKFRVSSLEKKEVELTLPAYRKYYGEGTIWYVKLYNGRNNQLCDVTIEVTDKHITYSGAQVNKSFEVEFENPHTFGYSYDFYMAQGEYEAIGEIEWMEIIASMLQAIEEAK